jgi:diguanylate cyclase (GGDEF)-like protein/PAS domain S-box-containing protein
MSFEPPLASPSNSLRDLLATTSFVDEINTALVLRDVDGVAIDSNQATLDIFDITRDELIGKPLFAEQWKIQRLDGSYVSHEDVASSKVLRSGMQVSNEVLGVTVGDRPRKWIFVNAWPVMSDERVVGALTSFIDVTNQTQTRRALDLLHEMDQLGLTVLSESEYLDQVCQIFVKSGGYRLAWIAMPSRDDLDDAKIVASAGATEYLYEGIVSSSSSALSGNGPTGMALRTGFTQIVNDMSKDPSFEPWRVRARAYGMRSAISMPILIEERRAVISLYSDSLAEFDASHQSALERVAQNVTQGTSHIAAVRSVRQALERARTSAVKVEEAQNDLRDSETRFRSLVQNSWDFVAVIDREGRLSFSNDSLRIFLDLRLTAEVQLNFLTYVHPDDLLGFVAAFNEIADVDEDVRFLEFRVVTAIGRTRHVEVRLENRLDDPTINGVVANGRDTTERVHLTRAYRTLSEGNRTLTHALDEVSLMKNICDVIVNTGKFALAWVGLVVHDEAKSIQVAAASGSAEWLKGATLTWGESDPERTSVVGSVIRSGESLVIDDMANDPSMRYAIEQISKYGLKSLCCFPLKVADETFGVISIVSNESESFATSEVGLLAELADDLAFGIDRLRHLELMQSQQTLLREGEEKFRIAFEQNSAPMVISSLDDRMVAANDAFCELVGFSREELIGQDSIQFTLPEDIGITEQLHSQLKDEGVDRVHYVKRYQRKDGRIVVTEVSRTPARDADGRTMYFMSSERDITEERALAEQLSHQALHDSLTDLANRTLFQDRLESARDRIVRFGGLGAILLIDLDDFKGVNDTYGHMVGDQLVSAVALRLLELMGDADTLSRIGGDEFIYLAEGLRSKVEVDEIAERILASLAEPFEINGVYFEQRASIGIVAWDRSTADSSALMQDADVALYEAKRIGKNRYVYADLAMHERAVDHFSLIQELRRAISNDELVMHFQPIVDMLSLTICGFEALMRWPHPTMGDIPPGDFIPLAEQTDLILELGKIALRKSLRAARDWPTPSGSSSAPYVTVNLSAHQFRDANLVATIADILDENGVDPQRLVIEVTESVTLSDGEQSLERIAELRAIGIRLALDDFGTGFSSLSYLLRFSPDIIKIDRYFVEDSTTGSANSALLESILNLGLRLNMTIVAEGVETSPQYELLRDLGCQLGQGFLWSAAVPGAKVAELIHSGSMRNT